MNEQILLDTGPLISILNRKDAHHQWASNIMDGLTPPLMTCEAVLTEAVFLLQRSGGDPTIPLKLMKQGDLILDFNVSTEAASLEILMKRYSDVPMSLADACLVRLSEIHKESKVFTLDRDFKIFRRFGRSVIPVISPW